MLIIGLDAAEKDLVAMWAATGDLSNFQPLLGTSLWGDIENPHGLETRACWPALTFGPSPAKTGRYDGSRQFNPASCAHISYRPERTPHPAIWEILRRAGRLCAETRDEADIPVYLSRGMGPGYSGTHLLDRILTRLENQCTTQLDSLLPADLTV